MSVRLRGRCRLTDKLAFYPSRVMSGGSVITAFDVETSSFSSVFIARSYLRSNAQNRHPFHHLPLAVWLGSCVNTLAVWLVCCVSTFAVVEVVCIDVVFHALLTRSSVVVLQALAAT